MITKDDFQNWWNSPVGQEFREMLKENLDKLAYGNMTDDLCRDHIANAEHVGQFHATMFYFNLTYEQLTGNQA